MTTRTSRCAVYGQHLALASVLLVSVLAGCAPATPITQRSPIRVAVASTPVVGNVYADPVLGFRLTLPAGWHAASYPGRHQPTRNTLVVLGSLAHTASTITIGVFHGTIMPTAFAARGTPPMRIGAYPAFAADTGLHQGKVPCVVRIMLADHDYVLAEWCAMDAASHATEFERVLATYTPSPTGFAAPDILAAPAEKSCATIRTAYGYVAAPWGRTLATPTAVEPNGGWADIQRGAYICSNTGSPDHYLFQCTELVNRYDAEQWGLPHIPGSAARYFDYYQNGTLHPGTVRDLPSGTYAFSDDASQGRSAFAPQPGDLLIFQDVANPARGWMSGLIASPGHVALITGMDAGHVYVAQENYSDRQYFLALSLAHTADGYTITDRSGVAGRIVRGWIHFTTEG
jgi:hypothetical protein